eukprot:5078033-Pyramimonas_sp.AAC.1
MCIRDRLSDSPSTTIILLYDHTSSASNPAILQLLGPCSTPAMRLHGSDSSRSDVRVLCPYSTHATLLLLYHYSASTQLLLRPYHYPTPTKLQACHHCATMVFIFCSLSHPEFTPIRTGLLPYSFCTTPVQLLPYPYCCTPGLLLLYLHTPYYYLAHHLHCSVDLTLLLQIRTEAALVLDFKYIHTALPHIYDIAD